MKFSLLILMVLVLPLIMNVEVHGLSTCSSSCHCHNGGICEDYGNGTSTCACRDGFSGPFCEIDVCGPSPCVNGICLRYIDSYMCECKDGWSDQNCTTDACAGDVCTNGGTCYRGPGFGSHCHCADGFFGANCETDVCAGDVCYNGGTCYRGPGVGRYCHCVDGFSGTNCETDACIENPCLNGGTCAYEPGPGRTCDCADGFSGGNCETDACIENSCMNNGICSYGPGPGRTCDCPDGFSGGNCETDACEGDVCQNDGTCIRGPGEGRTCLCTDGFKGDDCEKGCCSIDLESVGRDDPGWSSSSGRITIGGTDLDIPSLLRISDVGAQRGMIVAILKEPLDNTCSKNSVVKATVYDTYGALVAAKALKWDLRSLSVGTVVVGICVAECTYRLDYANSTLQSMGITVQKGDLGYRSSLAFIATIGNPNATVMIQKEKEQGPTNLSGCIQSP